MITINTNKGLIKVENWNDILARVGFTDNLNPKNHELKAILGRYMFGEKVRCGLSDCHTPHTKGYIVVTKDGRETNIGKDCGSKYFGVDFDEQARQFDRDMASQDNRELLWSLTFRLDELEEKIKQLRTGNDGANWVHTNCQALSNSAKLPITITRKLAELAKQKNGRLTCQRKATKQEIEDLETIQGRRLERPYYLDEPIAEIKGIEALYMENNLRDLLVIQLEENIKNFKTKNIDLLSAKELTHWSKWSQTIERTLDLARNSVAFGRALLTRKNLTPLLQIVDMEKVEERQQFNEFLATLPN